MPDVLVDAAAPHVSVVTLNRPARLNAVTKPMIDELFGTFARLGADDDVWVVILTGSGRGFCAGQDLKDLGIEPETPTRGPRQQGTWWQEYHANLIFEMYRFPKPLIAAVNGPASGAGLAYALAADIRLASRTARFNAATVKFGLSGADLGCSYFLPRILGYSAAAELMYTGRLIDAEESLRIGLVSRVIPDEDLMGEATALAEEITTNSPFGVRLTKQSLQANVDAAGLLAAMQLENRTQILANSTDDSREQLASFLEKRPPVYRNR
jgi:enoyl-CoA hydratase